MQRRKQHRSRLAQLAGHLVDGCDLLVDSGEVADLRQHRDAPVADQDLELGVAQCADVVEQLIGE